MARNVVKSTAGCTNRVTAAVAIWFSFHPQFGHTRFRRYHRAQSGHCFRRWYRLRSRRARRSSDVSSGPMFSSINTMSKSSVVSANNSAISWHWSGVRSRSGVLSSYRDCQSRYSSVVYITIQCANRSAVPSGGMGLAGFPAYARAMRARHFSREQISAQHWWVAATKCLTETRLVIQNEPQGAGRGANDGEGSQAHQGDVQETENQNGSEAGGRTADVKEEVFVHYGLRVEGGRRESNPRPADSHSAALAY